MQAGDGRQHELAIVIGKFVDMRAFERFELGDAPPEAFLELDAGPGITELVVLLAIGTEALAAQGHIIRPVPDFPALLVGEFHHEVSIDDDHADRHDLQHRDNIVVERFRTRLRFDKRLLALLEVGDIVHRADDVMLLLGGGDAAQPRDDGDFPVVTDDDITVLFKHFTRGEDVEVLRLHDLAVLWPQLLFGQAIDIFPPLAVQLLIGGIHVDHPPVYIANEDRNWHLLKRGAVEKRLLLALDHVGDIGIGQQDATALHPATAAGERATRGRLNVDQRPLNETCYLFDAIGDALLKFLRLKRWSGAPHRARQELTVAHPFQRHRRIEFSHFDCRRIGKGYPQIRIEHDDADGKRSHKALQLQLQCVRFLPGGL